MVYEAQDYFGLRSEIDKKFLLIEVFFDAHKLLGEILKELRDGKQRNYTGLGNDTIVERLGGSSSGLGNSTPDNPRRGPGRPRKDQSL